jgi:type I restriction enzyme S subunit
VTAFGKLVEINPRSKQDRSAESRFVAMEDVVPGKRYVSGKNLKRSSTSGSRFEPGDVLFARITPCLENGKIAQYWPKDGVPGQGSTEFYVLRSKPGVADQGYIYYLATSELIRRPAELSMRGASGRQRASADAILGVDVPDLPLSAQKKVANILSAYDDLIEVNTRRIAVLEEMARRLFDEWFGYGVARELQRPMVSAEQIIDFDPATPVPKEGEKPFVPMAALSTTSMIVDGIEQRTGNSGSKFRRGDTLFARITPCLENGKTGFVSFLTDTQVSFGSTEFVVMRGRDVSPEWVYLLARSEPFRAHAIKSMSGATGRQRVRQESLKSFPIVKPDPKAMDRFTKAVRPIFELVSNLADANAHARSARDLLLPKLISGEIDLEQTARDADRTIRRVVAA